MTDQPTPTPRSDAKADYWLEPGMSAEHEIVPADFARELERELDFSEKAGRQIWDANERLQADLVAERALADRLAKWLGNALECDREGDPIPAADIPPCREALAAWKEARRGA